MRHCPAAALTGGLDGLSESSHAIVTDLVHGQVEKGHIRHRPIDSRLGKGLNARVADIIVVKLLRMAHMAHQTNLAGPEEHACQVSRHDSKAVG